MTTEEIIIAVVRVLGSLPVLFLPFPGAIIAMLTDFSDLFLKDLLHEGGVRDYQEFDKWCDQVYMLTFLIVAVNPYGRPAARWAPVPRNIAVALYAYRMAGFVTFEVTQDRDLLILFPNVFEFWFVFVAGIQFFHLEAPPHVGASGARPSTRPSARLRLWGFFPYRYSPGQLTTVLALLTAAKLAQEYILHVGRWLDDFTATEAVEAIWRFLTPPY